jgi:uncharacterized membrane protein
LIAKFFNSSTVDLVIWLPVLLALLWGGWFVLRKIRAESLQKEPTASELILKFRESHRRGELSDAEFRTIKTTLAERLQEELKDDGETL